MGGWCPSYWTGPLKNRLNEPFPYYPGCPARARCSGERRAGLLSSTSSPCPPTSSAGGPSSSTGTLKCSSFYKNIQITQLIDNIHSKKRREKIDIRNNKNHYSGFKRNSRCFFLISQNALSFIENIENSNVTLCLRVWPMSLPSAVVTLLALSHSTLSPIIFASRSDITENENIWVEFPETKNGTLSAKFRLLLREQKKDQDGKFHTFYFFKPYL